MIMSGAVVESVEDDLLHLEQLGGVVSVVGVHHQGRHPHRQRVHQLGGQQHRGRGHQLDRSSS